MGAEELETSVAIPLEVGARRAAGRAAHPLVVAARASARSPSSSSPTPTTTARASSWPSAWPGRAAAASGHRRAAPVEPHRPPQRDSRVHARSRAGCGRPDDAARPRRVRGEEPPARGAGRGRGRAARRVPAPVPGPARPAEDGSAERDARRSDARRRGRERQRVRRLRRAGRHRVGGARGRPGRRPSNELRTTVVAVHERMPDHARRRRRRARSAGGAARHRAPAGGRGRELPRRQAVRRRHGDGRRGRARGALPMSAGRCRRA